MAERHDTTDLSSNRYGYGASAGARIGAGIAAGILAAMLMLGFMAGYSTMIGEGLAMPLKAIGALVYGVEALIVGPNALVIGALIQFGFSIVLGIIFALCVSRRTSLAATVLVGIIVGLAIWLVTDIFVLPATDPTMSARVALMPLGYFIANLLLGFGLGMTPAFLRAFSRT